MIGVQLETSQKNLEYIAKDMAAALNPRSIVEADLPPSSVHLSASPRQRGLCGAAALARAAGVSGRQAAQVKREVLTELEQERRGRCSRVMVYEPGTMRGLDQKYIGARPEQHTALIASDAAVPYRTSAKRVPAYTAREVARVLAEDFAQHGAPLVMRLDRASVHDADPVLCRNLIEWTCGDLATLSRVRRALQAMVEGM